ENHQADSEHGRQSCRFYDSRNYHPVFSGHRIVVVAEQQNLIDWRSDFSLRGFDQAETKVSRRILDAVEVSGNFSRGSEHHDTACVRELPGVRIVGVAETDGAGKLFDLRFGAGQKVPTLDRTGAAINSRIKIALRGSEFCVLRRVDTDGDNFEVL